MTESKYIAIVKFINRKGLTVWKAEMVGNGKRVCCRTENNNPGGYVSKSDALDEAKAFIATTGWPVVEEDQTITNINLAPSKLQRFITLPLGTRFKYKNGDVIWVVLKRHGCGLIAEWRGNDGIANSQAICSFANTPDECQTEDVWVINELTSNQPDMSGHSMQLMNQCLDILTSCSPDNEIEKLAFGNLAKIVVLIDPTYKHHLQSYLDEDNLNY